MNKEGKIKTCFCILHWKKEIWSNNGFEPDNSGIITVNLATT